MNDIARFDALLAYVRSSAFPSQMRRKPQLGLYYLAQHAADAGFQVRVDELSAGDQVVRRLCRLADEYAFPLLGLYVDHDNIWDLRRILPVLQQEHPELVIVLGGPEMTANAEGSLLRLPQAICGCIGEGEELFVELLSLPALSPEHLAECRGLAIREDDRIVFTPPRDPIERLDRLSIPRRRELNVDGVYRQPGSMITGRGCPGRCAFCFEGRTLHTRGLRAPKRLRLHSVERCLEEFDYLVREYNARYISILDDTFVADTGRLRAFCHGLIETYHGTQKWYCEARADTLARHPDLLPLMVEAGLVRLQIGGESGDQRILDLYGKGVSLEQILGVVEQAVSADLLSVFVNFIVGGAFETHETYERTRDFALHLLRLAPGRVAVAKSFYTPYPGTPMYDDPDAYGLQVLDWDAVTGKIDTHVFCRTEQLSKDQILALGQDFDEHKDETMRELALVLPAELIERHFRAEHYWALSTEWHEFLARDPAMRNYFDAVVRVGALGLEQAENRAFAGCTPVRTVEPLSPTGQGYTIRGPLGREQQLDSPENLVYELSAGKLGFEEILGRIADHLSVQETGGLIGTTLSYRRRRWCRPAARAARPPDGKRTNKTRHTTACGGRVNLLACRAENLLFHPPILVPGPGIPVQPLALLPRVDLGSS